MNTLMRWATRLYPAAWRDRYGAEFEALLEDVGPSGRDLWNVMRGALEMQLMTWNFWKLLAACAVTGALLAGVWSLTLKDRYVSTAVMRIDGSDDGLRQLQKLQQTVLSRKSLSDLIARGGLYKDERATQPLEDIIEQMRRKDLGIQAVGNGPEKQGFSISFRADSPTQAQAGVRDLVTAFVEQNVQVREENVNLEVLDPASLPASPTEPRRSRVVIMGLLAGLTVGLIAGAIRSAIQRRAAWSLKRIGIFAAAGLAAGIVIAAMIPDQFISTAVLRASADGAKIRAAEQQVLSEASLEAIIRKEGLYSSEVASDGMPAAVSKMRNKAVRIQMASGAVPAFIVSFQYGDQATTQRVTSDLVKGFVAAIPVAQVLDEPSRPESPSYPNRATIALFGTFIGLMAGFAATRFRRPVNALA